MTISLSNLTTNGALLDNSTINPFSTLTLTDSVAGDSDSATISFTAADGALSGAGLTYLGDNGGVATYALAATTAASLQNALQALVFTPTADQVGPGATVTTAFTLAVTGAPATPSQTLSNGVNFPEGLATDASGDVFVDNNGADDVLEFSASGNLSNTLSSGVSYPVAVATDESGNVFVASAINNTVEEFSSTGGVVRTLSTNEGTPSALATDASGDVFVANESTNTVTEFDASGGLVQTLSDGVNGPIALATDKSGDLFVSSNNNNSVEEFSPTGALLHTLTDGVSDPFGIATDASGDVFVANANANTVVEFSASGTLLRTLTSQMNHPVALATDAAGDVFVANINADDVLEFSASGALLGALSSGVRLPDAVATDSAGDVFVANAGSNTIEKFAPILAVQDSSTMVTATAAAPPTITGTLASQTTTSQASISPFANVSVGDTNAGADDTLTITVTGAGGALTGAGLGGGTGGVYTLVGSAVTLTGELDALVFTPTAGSQGTASPTSFSLSDVSNAYGQPATTATTNVTDVDPRLALGGASSSAILDNQTTDPFAVVTVTDTLADDSVFATIAFTSANGSLSGAGLSGPGVSGSLATYTLAATSAASLQTELQGLTFTPTAQQVGAGASVTTAFTLAVTGAPLTPSQTFTSSDGISFPASVATDAAGDVFVANSGNENTVEEFSASGALLHTLTDGVSYPQYVSTDAAGDVFVADSNGTLEEFSAAGARLLTVTTGVTDIAGLVTDASGDIFEADNGATAGKGDVLEFSATGALLHTLTSGIDFAPQALAIDSAGDVFVAGGDKVLEFDPSGDLLQTLNVNAPNSVALDAAGDIFVSRPSNDDVQEFSAAGALLGTLTDGVNQPQYVTTDAAGNVYVANHNNTVEEFSASGTLLRTLSNRVNGVYSVATDAAGDVFVANGGANTIEKFAPILAVQDSSTMVTATGAPCYGPGSLILTDRGEVAVEKLAIGDSVVTASGEIRPIKWLGHRRLDCRRHPRPSEALPVRIAAHAFAPDKPRRDLYVSPAHAILVDDALVPACALINGATVAQVDVEDVTYWHVELDLHDLLLAEGLAAESYLDAGNRDFFIEADAVRLDAAPDAPRDAEARAKLLFCRPFVESGPLVEAARERLRERAVALGWRLEASDFAELALLVDGERIAPTTRGTVARFLVPAGVRDLWLIAESARPCDVGPSADQRDLGVALGRLSFEDGLTAPTEIALDDARLGVGLYHLEDGARRWMGRRALLPAALFADHLDGGFLRVELCGATPLRWRAPAAVITSASVATGP